MTDKKTDPIRAFQSAVGGHLRALRAAGEAVARDPEEWRTRALVIVNAAIASNRPLTMDEATAVAAAAYQATAGTPKADDAAAGS